MSLLAAIGFGERIIKVGIYCYSEKKESKEEEFVFGDLQLHLWFIEVSEVTWSGEIVWWKVFGVQQPLQLLHLLPHLLLPAELPPGQPVV